MSTPSRLSAIHAYRSLRRTQRSVFGADSLALEAARKETYARFMQFKDETNTDVLDEKLTLAKQVEALLQKNVVQGVSEDGSTFKLRITENTELGDNESIKQSACSHRKQQPAAAAANS